jgi:hypothetical protein
VDITAWLRDLGLEEYGPAFRDNALDAEVLPELTEAHLERLIGQIRDGIARCLCDTRDVCDSSVLRGLRMIIGPCDSCDSSGLFGGTCRSCRKCRKPIPEK